MFSVRDGSRTLEFDGELVARSSSYRQGQDRWVEFELYVTKSGSYVLARTGQTRLYHALDCSIVRRNSLKPSDVDLLAQDYLPCETCRPDRDFDTLEQIAIERPRYFALVAEEPGGVLEALYKYDDQHVRYLTNVARRLIEDACVRDKRLERAYSIEYIP